MPNPTDRKARLAAARTWAGFRQAHFARETGTLVVVVEGDAAGLDGAYSTICDDHDQVVCHDTLAQARYHASNPYGWCEVCNGSDSYLDDEGAVAL